MVRWACMDSALLADSITWRSRAEGWGPAQPAHRKSPMRNTASTAWPCFVIGSPLVIRQAIGPHEIGPGVEIKDTAFCSLITFLPGGGRSREGIHRDGAQIADLHQIIQ